MFTDLSLFLTNPFLLLFGAFVIWMLVHAIRNEEWLWALFIFLFPLLNAVLYFFLVYRRSSGGSTTVGFELPGTQDRNRIKELESKIAHLDKAHHHLELGDIYFQQGKLDKALESYQQAIARDPDDEDIAAHLGQCFLRLRRTGEAKALLEKVALANPKHDYGHTMMALAETYQAQGDTEAAIQAWQRVLMDHSYARARVQLAEIYLRLNRTDEAKAHLREVIVDDAAAPNFQRNRDRVWIRQANRLLKQIG